MARKKAKSPSKGLSEDQAKNLDELSSKHPKLKVRWDPRTNSFRLITGLNRIDHEEADFEALASYYVRLVAGLFPYARMLHEIKKHKTRSGMDGHTTLAYRQYVGDARVVGSGFEVEIDKDNGLSSIQSSLVPHLSRFTGGQVDRETAELAIKRSDPENIAIPLGMDGSVEGEPVIIFDQGLARHALRYRVSGRSIDFFGNLSSTIWDYFLDRSSGDVIARHDLRRFVTGKGYGYYSGKGPYVNNVWVGQDLQTKELTASGSVPPIYRLESTIEDSSNPSRPRSVNIITNICQSWASHGADPSCTEEWGCANCLTSSSPDDNWTQRPQGIEVDCHQFSSSFFNYLRARFNHVGVNNERGQTCIVCAHHNTCATSECLVNQGYDRYEIVIPCGDGLIFGPFCAEDIIAHEWTHAILDEAGYWTGSGWLASMGESICDAMATFYKIAIHGRSHEMWLLGKSNWLRDSECPALRCLSDTRQGAILIKREDYLIDRSDPCSPATEYYVDKIWTGSVRGHQPDHWASRLDPQFDYPAHPGRNEAEDVPDNGWAHVNNGITNKAIYLMTEGGQSDIDECTGDVYRVDVGLGTDLAEQLVFYAGICGLGVPQMDVRPHIPGFFKDLRDALLERLWVIVGLGTSIPPPSQEDDARRLAKRHYLLQVLAIVNGFAAVGAPGCKGLSAGQQSSSASPAGSTECSPSDVYWSEACIDGMMARLMEAVNDPNGGPIFLPTNW